MCKVVADEHKRLKGMGDAKLVLSLKENFAGLGRIKVQKIQTALQKECKVL